MASSSKEGISKELQDQFCTITGANSDIAIRLLEACGGNLEMAIGMHMDGAEGAAGGAGPAVARARSSQNTAVQQDMDSQGAHNGDDNVRAPIPQKQEVLVQETRTNFGNIGLYGRRRQARSVFDGFRDFEAETRQQELELASGQAKSAKHKRLEDLFRPPIDLMFKGSFHAARDAGVNSNRWLMVNVQNVKEFQCQILNRDVWSNPSVKPIIKEHFIFWQVYNDSEEGKKYMQFYKVYHWPYIAILDPRTGENMVSWNSVDAMTFCELATTYLAEHNQPDGPSPTAQPPAKRKKIENITDATEDAQLEAALKASVVETKIKEPVVVSSDEFDSDVELETFTDSEDDTDAKPQLASKKTEKTSREKDNNLEKNSDLSEIIEIDADQNENKAAAAPVSTSPQISATSSSGSVLKDTKISHQEEEKNTSHDAFSLSSSSPPPRPISTSATSANPETSNLSKSENKESERSGKGEQTDSGVDELASSASSNSSKEGETSRQNKFQFVAQSVPEQESWRDHLGSKEDPEAVINVRFPNGKRQQFKVPCTSKLRALILFVQEEGYHKEMYELVTNFPKRRLSYLDVENTLKDHGLFPQETVFVQER